MRFNPVSGKQRLRLAVLSLGLAALTSAPAQAAGTAANPYDCAPQPTLAQNFAAWGDYNLYTPVTNAGFESGAEGWTLTGGASVVAGNQPWKFGGSRDRSSLSLPEGSSSTSAPLCIDETYPHFRLFVRNAGSYKGVLKIEVLYLDAKGNVINTKPYDYKTVLPIWQPSGMVGINVFTSKTTVAAAPIAFRFSTLGSGASFQIDDVYVDPRMSR